MENSNNTSTTVAAAAKRMCTWKWPPCNKWMQNNGNKLCASHNTRFNNGERPRDPTTGADTATAVRTTTTTTTSADTSTATNTKKKKKKKEKKVHKGTSALKKRKKRAEDEQLMKNRASKRKEKAKKAKKGNHAADKKNVKERDDDDDNDTSTERRKRRKRGKKAAKKEEAKHQSTKKAARSSSPSSSSSSSSSSLSSSSSSSSSGSISSISSRESQKDENRKRGKNVKKTRKKRKDKSNKSDHEPDEQEAQNQRGAVVRQESRGLEENEITELVNRYLAPHSTQFQHGINGLDNRYQQQFGLLYNQLNQMQEQVNYLIAQQQNQHEQFSCATSSFGGSFTFDEETKQNDHRTQLRSDSNVEQSKPPAKSTATQSKPSAKSRSKSKISKDIKETSPKPIRSKTSNEDKSTATQCMPPAKSQSKSKISKDKKESSPKPRRSKTSDDDKTRVDYYKKFPDNKRGEPAAVDIGANAGLKNSNVVCYSNAILQCIANCFYLSDFSLSDNHPEFQLNHAFACLMNSMVKGGQSIDPSSFMKIFRPLFQPSDADEKEGMYNDFA